MAKSRKCRCNTIARDEDRDFLLTNHHPQCPMFNPASELFDLEMQCRKFMSIIIELKNKISEMQNIVDRVD